MAPEIAAENSKDPRQADAFSLGALLFSLIFGYQVFQSRYDLNVCHLESNQLQRVAERRFEPIVAKGWRAHFPSSRPCSDGARDLIAGLLEYDSAKRLSVG